MHLARIIGRFGRRRALQWAGLRIIRGESTGARSYRRTKATCAYVREAIGVAISPEQLRGNTAFFADIRDI